MPVYTLTALDRLIEPATPSSSSQASSMDRNGHYLGERKPPFPLYSFYPPLYVTPPQQRLPSPSAFSPSPYIVNHKRRGPPQNGTVCSNGGAVQSSGTSQQNGFHISHQVIQKGDKHQGEKTSIEPGMTISQFKMKTFPSDGAAKKRKDEIFQGEECSLTSTPIGKISVEEPLQQAEISEVFEMEINSDDFDVNHTPRESVDSTRVPWTSSKHSSSQQIEQENERLSSLCLQESLSAASLTCEEFFDAPDIPFAESPNEAAFSETGIFVSTDKDTQGELAKRMISRLQEASLRRIQAEEALASLQKEWDEVAEKFLSIGLSFPSRHYEANGTTTAMGQDMADVFEQFNQKLIIARFVGASVARGALRAEKEEELESLLACKNKEIARLRDKLLYYELVNHEMSQRNQEAVEMAQRRRRRRRKRQKFALSCIAGVLFVGTTALLTYKVGKVWNLRLGSSTDHQPIEHGSSALDGAE